MNNSKSSEYNQSIQDLIKDYESIETKHVISEFDKGYRQSCKDILRHLETQSNLMASQDAINMYYRIAMRICAIAYIKSKTETMENKNEHR